MLGSLGVGFRVYVFGVLKLWVQCPGLGLKALISGSESWVTCCETILSMLNPKP